MSNNQELISQAIAAIPLWRAFLDQKEAEQDALLAEMRKGGQESKAKQLLSSLTQKFKKPPTIEPVLDVVSSEETESKKMASPEETTERATQKPDSNEKILQVESDNEESPEFTELFN